MSKQLTALERLVAARAGRISASDQARQILKEADTLSTYTFPTKWTEDDDDNCISDFSGYGQGECREVEYKLNGQLVDVVALHCMESYVLTLYIDNNRLILTCLYIFDSVYLYAVCIIFVFLL